MSPALSRRGFLGAALAGSAGLLAACAGGSDSADPAARAVGSVVSRWDTDPWALGSYSALPAGTSWRVRERLAQTVVSDRLVLAGEYADLSYPATVHGAYGSGRRAAALLDRHAPRPGRAVVVGAGMAGLAAATDLGAAGWQVEVIEARDRVGGRILTDRSLGVPVELGASWVHGVTGNPMVRLVKTAGLSLAPTNFDDARAHDLATGRTAPGVGAADDELWQLIGEIADERPPRDRSVAAALTMVGWRGDTPQRRLAELSELVMEYGVDLDRLGAQALWEGGYYRGGDSLVVGGFAAVPELLAQPLSVRLGTPVRRVEVSEGAVTVGLDDGELTVDAVVVAVPLAVLGSGVPQVNLPADTIAALASLVTGNLEKVFLRYPEVWWPDAQVLQVMGTDRWAEWYPLDGLVDAPVVMGLAGGGAIGARPGDDAELAAEAAGVLQKAYP